MLRLTQLLKVTCILFLSFILYSCKENTVEPVSYGSISGTVFDSSGIAPMGEVNITTNPPTSSVFTDKTGRFVITNVPTDKYTVTAKKSGFLTTSVSILVEENITTNAVMYIEKESTTNNAPKVADNPAPADMGKSIPVSLTLSWQCTDPDNDSLKYDVYLYEPNSSAKYKIAADIKDTTLKVDKLKYGTTYLWQVVSKDEKTITNGNVWSFSTKAFPNNPFVFASNREGNYEIYSTDMTEENTIKLTNSPFRKTWPRYSPAKDKIAFISDMNNDYQIYIMNYDGSGMYQLTTTSVAGYNNNGIGFCWSPDSKSIIYPHYNQLYKIDVNGYILKLIATAPAGRHFRECDWSSKGDKIAVVTVGINPYDTEIYTMDADGSNMSLFVDNLPGVIENPTFSIDGRDIMYSRDISGYEVPTGRQLNSHIFIKSLDDSTIVDLSLLKKEPGTNDLYPRFSANGGKIIFTNTSNTGTGIRDIYVTDLKGEVRNKVIQNGEMPDWK